VPVRRSFSSSVMNRSSIPGGAPSHHSSTALRGPPSLRAHPVRDLPSTGAHRALGLSACRYLRRAHRIRAPFASHHEQSLLHPRRCAAHSIASPPSLPLAHSGPRDVRAGIFGEAEPTSAPVVTSQKNSSSVSGGIFGEAEARPSTAARTDMTKSSVVGGIFSGDSVYATEEPTSARRAPAVIDASRIAGAATKPSESFSLFAGEGAAAPLAPLNSARSNKNGSSIEGGIFGGPKVMTKPAIQRNNPNASSIEGGIFG
jgi:hypothetical protein